MNDTIILSFFLQHFQLRAATNFYKSSMELKIRFFINLIQSNFKFLLMLEWVKVLPTSYPTESLVLDQHSAKQNFSWHKSLLGFNNLVTKERFYDKPDLSTLSKTLGAVKIHACTKGVSTIAIPKHGCGLDQMNWQEVVKLLRDIFANADLQILVYTGGKWSPLNVRRRRRWVLSWRWQRTIQ